MHVPLSMLAAAERTASATFCVPAPDSWEIWRTAIRVHPAHRGRRWRLFVLEEQTQPPG